MSSQDKLEALKSVVETWNVEKVSGREFAATDMRKFIELMNNRTRHLIHILGVENNPDFYTGLFELAQHATTMTSKAKTFGDGQDLTNV